MSRRTLALPLLLAACTPARPGVETSASALISDATSGGTRGFYFLTPVVPVDPPPGVNVPGLGPEVRLETDGGALVARWPGVLGDDTAYHVNLATRGLAIVDGAPYRILVVLGARTLGYADARFGANKAELKHLDRTQEVGLVDGSTLPMKFRVQAEALVDPLAAVTGAQALARAQVEGTTAGLIAFGFDAEAQATTPIALPGTVKVYRQDQALAAASPVTVAELLARARDLSLATPSPTLEPTASSLRLELLGAAQAPAPTAAYDLPASRLQLVLAGYETERLRCALEHAFAAATALFDPRDAADGCEAAVDTAVIGDIVTLSYAATVPGDTAARLYAEILAVLEAAARDARADADAERAAALAEVEAKSAQLAEQTAEIQRQRAEAGARFNAALDAADRELVIGVASGALLATAATSNDGMTALNLDAIAASVHLAVYVPMPYEACLFQTPWDCMRLLSGALPPISEVVLAELGAAVQAYLAVPLPFCSSENRELCLRQRLLNAQISDAYQQMLARYADYLQAAQTESRQYLTLANASKARHDVALASVDNLKD